MSEPRGYGFNHAATRARRAGEAAFRFGTYGVAAMFWSGLTGRLYGRATSDIGRVNMLERLGKVSLAVALLAVAGAGPASAGFLDFLFPKQQRPPPQQRVAPSAPAQPRRTAPAPVPVTNPQNRSYCVRTCDGYYFAVGFARNQNQIESQREMCGASCGGAPMKLYTTPMNAVANNGSTAPAIERALDETGAPYTDLPTAYGFRDNENPACACTNTGTGLPQIPLSVDPTLRSGDIVVMPDGLKVFRGSNQVPHSDEDFESVANARALPGIVRQQMMSLQQRIAPQ